MNDNIHVTGARPGRTRPQPAGRLEEFRGRLGADRHRARRPRGRGRGPRRRQRRRQVDPGEGARRRAPADSRALSPSSGQKPVTLDRPRTPRSTSASPRCSRTWRCARTSTSSHNIFLGREQQARHASTRWPWRSAPPDAAQRALGTHSRSRARGRRLALRRAAPDGRDRAIADARPEADHARRADRRARRGPDRRGAEPDRARA